MNAKLEEALTLRKNNQLEESKERLLQLIEELGDNDPILLFECACAHDMLGLETQAIPFYERAIEGGLPEPQRQEAFTNLGSSYRCVGEYHQAEKILVQAEKDYPEDEAIKVFLAITRYNLGQANMSVRQLLHVILRVSKAGELRDYDRALSFYADRLDETWRE